MFFNYLRAMNCSPVQQSRNKYAYILLLCYAFFFTAQFAFGGGASSVFGIFGYFALFVAIGYGFSRRLSPSVSKLLPISSKKRVLYDYTGVLFAAAVAFAVVAAFFVAVCGIVIACIGGVALEEMQQDFAAWQAARGGDCYDIVFSVAFILCCYFGGMTGGYIKRGKFYTIYHICFIVAMLAAMFFTALPYNLKYGILAGGDMNGSVFSNAAFTAMSQPWVCIACWFVAAACLIGAAIWLSFRYYDPKKY